MIEALWGISFVSNTGDGGYGVVVLETNRIMGGDSSFVYIGDYDVSNGKISARVRCTNDRKALDSIFNGMDEFNLELEGDLNETKMVLRGRVVEQPGHEIAIQLDRRAELP